MKSTSRKRPKKIRKHSSGSLSVAALAIVALVAVFSQLIKPQRVESNPVPIPLVAADDLELLMPTRAVARGERLKDVPMTKGAWPRSKVSGTYLVDLQGTEDMVALNALPAMYPISISNLGSGSAEGNAVIEGIPESMRAITVKVDAESAVEGWARSGSYVDVIVIKQGGSSDLGLEAKVIAENVRILSAGRSTEPLHTQAPSAAPATVTLLVSQEDALRIKTAAGVGRLTFSLRGFGDDSPTAAVRMDQRALMGPDRGALRKVQVYRGKAVGPDGKSYVLDADARWVEYSADLQGSGTE